MKLFNAILPQLFSLQIENTLKENSIIKDIINKEIKKDEEFKLSHATKFEKFLFSNFKSELIKNFALRNYEVVTYIRANNGVEYQSKQLFHKCSLVDEITSKQELSKIAFK